MSFWLGWPIRLRFFLIRRCLWRPAILGSAFLRLVRENHQCFAVVGLGHLRVEPIFLLPAGELGIQPDIWLVAPVIRQTMVNLYEAAKQQQNSER